jgi:hypothetical protein
MIYTYTEQLGLNDTTIEHNDNMLKKVSFNPRVLLHTYTYKQTNIYKYCKKQVSKFFRKTQI